MKRIILKASVPLGRGKIGLKGLRIKVSDADYARLVPRYARDADPEPQPEPTKGKKVKEQEPVG